MLKLNQLSVAIVLISLASAAQSATVTPAHPNTTTVEYSNGTHNAVINEQASTHTTLNVNNVQINGFESDPSFTDSNFPFKSAISLGGNNGYLGNNHLSGADQNYERYDNLTINVDASTVITAILNGELTGIYSRTDANGALTQINNNGTINITSTGAGIIRGILAENLGTSTGGNGGLGNQLGGDVSVNLGATSNMTLQGDNGIYGLLAIGNNATVNSAAGSQITLNGTATSTLLLGIATKAYFGTATVNNAGDITINGASSTAAHEIKGIVASESRYSDINNSGNINVTGNNGFGIHSSVTLDSIVANSGNIDVIGDNSTGIYSASRFGNASIVFDNALSHVNVSNQTPSSSAIGMNSISTEAGGAASINIKNADYIKTESTDGSAKGIYANNTVQGNATIDIDNVHQITASGNDNVYAIHARAVDGNATVTIGSNVDLIQSLADNAISGTSSEGVYATTTKGDATITSHAQFIYVTGQNNDGLIASSENGNAKVTATGTIITKPSKPNNQWMFGIVAQSSGNDNKAVIDYTGSSTTYISTEADSSSALYANARNNSSAETTARNANLTTSGNFSHGIYSVGTGITTTGASAVTAGTSTVDFSGFIAASGSNSSGIYATTVQGANEVTILNNSVVQGGTGESNLASGVTMVSTDAAADSQKLTIGSGAIISATNDSAIYASTQGSATTHNNGTIIGYTTYTPTIPSVTFNNNLGGRLELKDFGQLGTTKSAMITSNFGTNGIFNNKGSVAFSTQNADGTATHAQFTNVATFDHSGVIDLRTNGYTGNTLNITNGGNGDFISNGGSLFLNTQVSAPTGPSDKLIVDNVITGTGGTTNIYVIPATGSVYGYLQGDGIELVHVNGTSSTNAFTLGQPVTNGIYQYGLVQGGAASADSWYLQNIPGGFNPSVDGYLSNMSAATNTFTHSLRDRPLEGEGGTLSDTSKFYNLWLRTKVSHSSSRSVYGSISNRDRTYLTQMGSDIGLWQLNGGNLHVGLMAGYSDYENTSTSRVTRTKASSSMKGYNVGVYGTWFQNDDGDLGLSVDTWSQHSWFRNEIAGKGTVPSSKKYNSTVWSNSVELGYGISLGKSQNYEWIVTPQTQLTYHLFDADNQYDKNESLSVRKNKGSGLVSRAGTRIHVRSASGKPTLQPYLELNWMNSTVKNQFDFNGTTLKGTAPKNTYETKVGVQGSVNEKFSVSAQIGKQWGKEKFNQYNGQLNLTYRF